MTWAANSVVIWCLPRRCFLLTRKTLPTHETPRNTLRRVGTDITRTEQKSPPLPEDSGGLVTLRGRRTLHSVTPQHAHRAPPPTARPWCRPPANQPHSSTPTPPPPAAQCRPQHPTPHQRTQPTHQSHRAQLARPSSPHAPPPP